MSQALEEHAIEVLGLALSGLVPEVTAPAAPEPTEPVADAGRSGTLPEPSAPSAATPTAPTLALAPSVHTASVQPANEPIADAPVERYPFDEDFQRRIVTLLLNDTGFARRTDGLVVPDYFESMTQATIVALALDHYKVYRTVPAQWSVWKQILRDAVVARRLRKDMVPEVFAELKGHLGGSVADRDYVVDQVSSFARSQALSRAIYHSVDLLEKGRSDDAQKLLEKAFRVGAMDDVVEIDYWQAIDERTAYRRDRLSGAIKSNGIPTGIKEIDSLLYHGGWGRQELSVIMGGAKAGKSTALGEFGLRASLLGFNVIYITLEVASRIISDRLDANAANTDMDKLETHLNSVQAAIETLKQGVHGVFKLFQMPSGALTPGGLRRILERYRADGLRFDLIIVDYADIMAPDNTTDSPIENSKQVWLGLRAIAFYEDAAVLTATQTNREGFKASVAKAEHAAEDFNKVRIADLILSINRSDEEKQSGEARLYLAASRNQRGEITIHVKQDLNRMKFITKVTQASS